MDLISRKAAISAAKHAWAKGLEPSQYIEIIPTVPAVPLDKLCEWLEVHARTPIYNLRHTAEWWKEELERWMEGQDATD